MPKEQNFQNHGRVVPAWHIGVFFPLVINLFWSIYRVYDVRTVDSIVVLLVAIALLLMFGSARAQILRVQDRVIRLEMRLRLERVLPADMQPHIAQLTVPQLIALRFASDEELPALVQDVIAGRCTTQKEIKGRVKNWQADFQRA